MRRVRDFSQYRSRVKRDDIKDCVKNVLGNLFIEPPGGTPLNILPGVGSVNASVITDLQSATPSSLSIPALTVAAVIKYPLLYDGNGSDALASILTGGTASQSTGSDAANACDGSTSTTSSITTYGNQWWKYDFGSGVTKRFGVFSYYIGYLSYYYGAKNTIIQGSNNGTDWTNIITLLIPGTPQYTWVSYTVPICDYRYYRIFMSDNQQGSGYHYLYEVRFYPKTQDDNVYASGATATVLDNAFIYTGKTFSKWNTAADGSGTDYDPADTLTITGATTLYAIWA